MRSTSAGWKRGYVSCKVLGEIAVFLSEAEGAGGGRTQNHVDWAIGALEERGITTAERRGTLECRVAPPTRFGWTDRRRRISVLSAGMLVAGWLVAG